MLITLYVICGHVTAVCIVNGHVIIGHVYANYFMSKHILNTSVASFDKTRREKRVCVFICVDLSLSLSLCLSPCMCVCLRVCLSDCMPARLSACLWGLFSVLCVVQLFVLIRGQNAWNPSDWLILADK